MKESFFKFIQGNCNFDACQRIQNIITINKYFMTSIIHNNIVSSFIILSNIIFNKFILMVTGQNNNFYFEPHNAGKESQENILSTSIFYTVFIILLLFNYFILSRDSHWFYWLLTNCVMWNPSNDTININMVLYVIFLLITCGFHFTRIFKYFKWNDYNCKYSHNVHHYGEN